MTEAIILVFSISLSLLLVFFSYRSLIKKNRISALLFSLLSFIFVSITILVTTTIFEETTIKRLTEEHVIATIEFKQIDQFHYSATFTEPHKQAVTYDLYGDQWQIDARVLKWNGVAEKIGLKPIYQFERLSGRYQNIRQAVEDRRSIYPLYQNNHLNSIWDYLVEYQNYIPYLDAQYGSGTYMPMIDGAIFNIKLTNNGLLARPRNYVASQSVKHWL